MAEGPEPGVDPVDRGAGWPADPEICGAADGEGGDGEEFEHWRTTMVNERIAAVDDSRRWMSSD